MEFHLTATGIICHMDHTVYLPQCHPTQVNTPCPNPSQTDRYSIYLPRRDERLSWPRGLVTYRPQMVTHPSTNRAQCRLTKLITANALISTLRRHPGVLLFVEILTQFVRDGFVIPEHCWILMCFYVYICMKLTNHTNLETSIACHGPWTEH